MKCLILRLFESRESLTGHPIALLEITPELAGVFRQRHEDFLEALKKDGDLYTMTYQDFSVSGWHEANVKNVEEDLLDEVLEEHILVVEEFPEFARDDRIPVDSPVMCVAASGFYWRCRFKYSVEGQVLESDFIPWEVLDDVYEDRPTRPSGVGEAPEGTRRETA